MPHGMCYLWEPTTLWSNVIGDAITALCYFLIPTGMIYFLRKRRDFDMGGVMLAFALFIISCGAVHAISVVNVWVPFYNTAGILKGVMAFASVWTLALMFIKMPDALQIPSPTELQRLNKQLRQQIEEKEALQKELEEKAQKLEYTVKLLNNTQKAASIGSWKLDLVKNDMFWSDQVYDIHEIPLDQSLDLEEGINFYTDSYREQVRETVRAAVEEKKPWDEKWQLSIGNDDHKWVRSIGYPVEEEEKVVALEGLFMDIDKQTRAEIQLKQHSEELEQINSELEAFSYSISHDLRAPLRSINGFANILHEDYQEVLDDEGNRLLGIIRDSAVQMGDLIDDILTFSRLGRKELKTTMVDVNEIVHQIKHQIENEYQGESTLTITVDDLPTANADTTLLNQVLYNLIENALKYSSTKPSINIHVGFEKQIEGNREVYYVRDNGIGFDTKYSEKIFGVFQRLQNKNEFEGTGVGLAIVKRIINKHRGTVWAESKIGTGSTFYFSLGRQVNYE